jgi:hypothetical protein
MVFRVTNEYYGFKLAILPGKVTRIGSHCTYLFPKERDISTTIQ